MASIELDHVSKVFPNGTHGVRDVSLRIADGEFVIFLGPSGCGKSTLLRMIAGLEDVTSGAVRIDGRDMTHVAPRDRNIAVVFQSYALYPHMTVRGNMGFALKMRGTPPGEIERKIDDAAALLGLGGLLDRRPAALSGGQRQRVALGRAIVRDPAAFLLDEPLSNLDAQLRAEMRLELVKLHRRLNRTIVHVTHDQIEAMTMGDRICILRDGRLEQEGPPLEVYANPANMFVARFLATPPMNLVPASLSDSGAPSVILSGGARLAVPERHREAYSGHAGRKIVLGMRPEDIHAGPRGPDAQPFDARVVAVEALGAENILIAQIGEGAETREISARLDRHFSASVGADIRLHADLLPMHLFDPATEACIPRPTLQGSGR